MLIRYNNFKSVNESVSFESEKWNLIVAEFEKKFIEIQTNYNKMTLDELFQPHSVKTINEKFIKLKTELEKKSVEFTKYVDSLNVDDFEKNSEDIDLIDSKFSVNCNAADNMSEDLKDAIKYIDNLTDLFKITYFK